MESAPDNRSVPNANLLTVDHVSSDHPRRPVVQNP